jgi:type IV pilus assembly protein PilB
MKSDPDITPLTQFKESSCFMGGLRTGELLVEEGFVKEEDIQRALLVQKEEAELSKLPLGQILMRLGVLSPASFRGLLNHPDLRKDIGSLALEEGLVRKDQLDQCLAKRKPDQPVGEALINEGLLTRNDIEQLVKKQLDSLRLGELAVKLKLISENDLKRAVKIQRSPRAIGEILCDLGLIKPLELNYLLSKYNKHMRVGEILVRLGYIDRQKLALALQEQKYSSAPLGEILIQKKFITREQLSVALAREYNIPFRPLTGLAYSEEQKKKLTALVSQKYAEKNLVLPVSIQGNDLTLALSDPQHLLAAHELKVLYGELHISCILITKEKFEELFETLYGGKVNDGYTEDKAAPAEEINFMEIDLDEEIGRKDDVPIANVHDSETEEIVNYIIKYGIINRASDIHIEQDLKGPRLRYRIDGILQEANIEWLRQKLYEKTSAIVSRIKVMSNLDITEKRLPQDGAFRIHSYDKATKQRLDVDFRVATCRAIVGENVTIRILDSRKAHQNLESLSHSPHILKPLKNLLRSSAGMILVSGPTGSGKSSTLYGALRHVYNPGIKIITAEDPIEYNFPGIMQTQVNPKIGLTFPRLLRSFLRLDPDVILVGEMRDEETARISFDAAQTGHLLLSTVHTNDAINSLSRLLDLKIDYGQIGSCLMAVLAQRLVRKICTSCPKEYEPSDQEWGLLFKKYPSSSRFYRGEGCKFCNYTGYKGRMVISEIFIVDREMAHAISQGLHETQIRRLAVERGMKSMLEDGMSRLHETTLSEIIRVVPHNMIKDFRSREDSRISGESDLENSRAERGSLNESSVPPDSFFLSNPEAEKYLIEQMYDRYQMLETGSGNNHHPVNPTLFTSFVVDSFQEIRNSYHCKAVAFSIQNKEDKTLISATPVN